MDGDAEPSAASGGCSEAEHPQRSKKSSKRAARRFFSGTARRQGLRLAEEGPRRQPNSPLFPIDSPALFDYYGVGKYPPKGVLKYE